MLFLRLDFWASQYIFYLESQSVSLEDTGKPLSSVNISRLSLNISPPTRVPPIAGLQYLLKHYMLVLFESTKSYINQL